MNIIDIVLGLIFVVAFFVGFSKGFLRVLASLIGLVAGVYCAIYFSDYVQVYIERWFDWGDDLSLWSSVLITFLLVMVLFALIGRILTKVVDFAMMGWLNKFLGGLFNVLKFAFLASVIFMFISASENYSILNAEKRENSRLYKPVAILAPAILPAIEKHIDMFEVETIGEFPQERETDTLDPE